MSASQLIAAGEKIWGSNWQTCMAAAVGVDISTVQAWAEGTLCITQRNASAIECFLWQKNCA
jgi:hypothetical protein